MAHPKTWLKLTCSRLGLGLLALFVVTGHSTAVAQSPISPLSAEQGNLRYPLAKASLAITDVSTMEPLPAALLERGRVHYETGRFMQAVAVWTEAAQGFEQAGNHVSQGLSLNYLSLAYQALGEWEPARATVERALNLVGRSPEPSAAAIHAQALNTLGQLQSRMGQTVAALESWQRAEAIYQSIHDDEGRWGSQINQAQALQALGLYRRSQTLLTTLQVQLDGQPNTVLKVKGLLSLGTVRRLLGDLPQSQEALESSLVIAQGATPTMDTSEILLSLGNTARDQQEAAAALQYYQQAASQTPYQSVQTEARLNQLSLSLEQENDEQAIALLPQIEANLDTLPPSRMAIYANVNFAQSLTLLAQTTQETRFLNQAEYILVNAVQQAKTLGDPRAEAYGLVQGGLVAEQRQQWSQARHLNEAALQMAQGLNASDITARAAWQLGRIFTQTGDQPRAIAAYDSAFNALQSLRGDLIAINPDIQFSFADTIEPVYREYVALLLASSDHPQASLHPIEQDNLKKAREVIEALQLAELDNFFREACLEVRPVQIDQIDPHAAVIYPIILSDRLAIILSLPGQPIRHYTAEIDQAELQQMISQMRQSLNPAFPQQERLRLYQQGYDWLIRPAEAELARLNITTLVFVLDGELRNIPMSALHDGQQYLIEKYNTSLSLGLQLLEPRPLGSLELQALTAGLSEAREGFQSLPEVETELATISTELPTRVLFNQAFTNANLQTAINTNALPIIHLATHGQFSSSAEETFLLSWNGKIPVKELDALLRSRETGQISPIELLVLSACQTAQGDSRATLGLAGVAVRSGARSTLATLWAVRDKSTAALMAEFYKQLGQSGNTKAEALRQAQLKLLQGEYEHPIFWAPFVLVGNWL